MECNRWEEEGLLYTSGELSSEKSAQYKAHLSDCPQCAKEHKEYEELLSTVIQGEYPLEGPSAAADARIKERILEAGQDAKQRKAHYLFGMSFVTLLRRSAVALVVVALSYFATTNLGGNVPVESSQVAQSETTITISDSVSDSLKKFQEGNAEGIKSVNVRDE